MTDIERRYTLANVEPRGKTGETRKIGGYAAKFGKESQNLGGFVEVIAPPAFNRSRGNDWPGVMARYNHDDNMLLGTTAGRTLTLTVDEEGLLYEVVPPQGRSDVLELVERGDVTKSSFAFRVIGADGDEWGLTSQNFPLRTLLSVDLVDVAPVNSPAYLDTTTAIRSLAAHCSAPVEDVLRLAQENNLRKLLIRTDKGFEAAPKTDFGAAARMAILGRQNDPSV